MKTFYVCVLRRHARLNVHHLYLDNCARNDPGYCAVVADKEVECVLPLATPAARANNRTDPAALTHACLFLTTSSSQCCSNLRRSA